jgi:hypothetical protein
MGVSGTALREAGARLIGPDVATGNKMAARDGIMEAGLLPMRPISAAIPVARVSRLFVVAALIASFGTGAMGANAGPARAGACPACVLDRAGNLIACNKPVNPAPAEVLKRGCCKKTGPGHAAAEAAVPEGAHSAPAPVHPPHKHDSKDGCAGKCEQCCATPGQAPLVAPLFAIVLNPADSVRTLALTRATEPPAGVHVSVFHPPRA